MNETLKLINELKSLLTYFSENAIKVFASEDGEPIDISYMADEGLEKIKVWQDRESFKAKIYPSGPIEAVKKLRALTNCSLNDARFALENVGADVERMKSFLEAKKLI